MSDTYVTIGKPPETRTEQLMFEILTHISEKLCEFYIETKVKPNKIANLEMICMITTNVFVNLLQLATRTDIPSEHRLEVMETCLNEVSRISMSLWLALEASRANNDVSH